MFEMILLALLIAAAWFWLDSIAKREVAVKFGRELAGRWQLQLLDEAWINQSGVYIGGNTSSLGQFNNSFAVNIHPHYTILTLHNLAYNFVYPRYKISY